MKNYQNNSARATALQVTLSVALLLSLAILFASSLKATGPAAPGRPQPDVVAQDGFFPPLPAPVVSGQPGFYPALSRPLGPTPTCTPIEVDDKVTTNDPTQLGRINPGGVASSCGAPNACNTLSGLFHYKAFSLVNGTGTDRCVMATLSSNCSGENAIFATAYLDSFDPSNICANLIGDAGVPASGSATSFSFNVPAGAAFIVVVNETTVNAGCGGFKLEVFGLCGLPTPTPAPSPTPQNCQGAFVIGDLEAVVGNHVTFWGARWAHSNSLSGGAAPDSFKGFARCTNPNPPQCGGTFTSSPGNTPGEPDTVPEFITVIAAHRITQSGPVIDGDIPMMAVVRTEPGYGPNPGHPGRGTVVSIVCAQPRAAAH